MKGKGSSLTVNIFMFTVIFYMIILKLKQILMVGISKMKLETSNQKILSKITSNQPKPHWVSPDALTCCLWQIRRRRWHQGWVSYSRVYRLRTTSAAALTRSSAFASAVAPHSLYSLFFYGQNFLFWTVAQKVIQCLWTA